ncbi:MAG: MBL fold metallo-hydrolase [Archangium sp.]
MNRSALALLLLAGCATTPAPVLTSPPPAVDPLRVEGPARPPLAVTRVAHASVLLELGSVTVLTDPWFTESPAYHHGELLSVQVDGLPKLDAVLVSHDHYDHFDIDAFTLYRDKSVPMFVCAGMGPKARAAGFTDVIELKAGESATRGALTVTAFPGAHGMDEITFVVEANAWRVFFGGDSLLTPALKEAARTTTPVDLALPAVNGLRAFGSQKVMNAKEAAELVSLLRARVAVPTHYTFKGSAFTDTFILGYDGTAEEFVETAREKSPSTQTRVLSPGQRLVIENERPPAP